MDRVIAYWIERDTGEVRSVTLGAHDLRGGTSYAWEVETKHARDAVRTEVIPLAEHGSTWAATAVALLEAEAEAHRASLQGAR